MPAPSQFLEEHVRRPISLDVAGLAPIGVFVGAGDLALEVAVFSASARPHAGRLQEAWRLRRGGRSVPLLVVALIEERAFICGPSGDAPPVHVDVDVGAAERVCSAALEMPDRHAARLFLADALPSLETSAPGVRNQGLFALHELAESAPRRPDWADHRARSRAAIGAEGADLLRRLGFAVERLDNMTQLLKGADRRLALAVLLDRSDTPEAGTPRFGNLSPISYALAKADAENLDWVLLLQGDRIRLYPARTGVGVGRRGSTETYAELQLSVLGDEHLPLLTLIFSAQALAPGGTVAALLDNSRRFADSLAKRLRERIYEDVVPGLAKGIAEARALARPSAEDLDLTYRMALTVLFRLLFVAYAEDRDLLPFRHSDAYRRRSLKEKAIELAEHARNLRPISDGVGHWDEVVRIWNAVDRGDAELSVPAYNGGLFSRLAGVSPAGAAIAELRLPNQVFEPALRALLLSDVGDDGLQPVDFRSLGVREFGTIYEGLLESELSVAEQDLGLDAKGNYAPVRGNAAPVVRRGEIYLHDRSGARKSSGSYFTKSFAVEHLLDRALTPALQEHLERVAAMDEADAAEAFFDFRVADIAMGSGHFLVAAVDRIEQAFSGYLARDGARGGDGVRAELARLKTAARESLGELADEYVFEDGPLLRRQIARRCVYGVDLNPLSVELARLAIWIHTFVPGLPLSVLDHNLVVGNALVGVGTVDEIREQFEAAGTMLFPVDAHSLLSTAARPLRRLANLSDATIADVARARDALVEAEAAVGDVRALCDLIAAMRLDPEIRYQFENWERDRDRIQSLLQVAKARRALDGLRAFHFPVAFPEVFIRRRSGFDALIGNPPWEKARVEEHEFWGRHFPGFRSLKKAEKRIRAETLRSDRPDLVQKWEKERRTTEKSRDALRHLPGMATGHPDMFRAFLWRFCLAAAPVGGYIGLVLPGEAFKIKGTAHLRQKVSHLLNKIEVNFLTNKREWVFDGVHEQKFIAFVSGRRGRNEESDFSLTGECRNLEKWEEKRSALATVSLPWLYKFSSSLVLPTIESDKDIDVLNVFMNSPSIRDHSSISIRRVYADFETTRDRQYWLDSPSEGSLRVYGGESFSLWEPDRGPTKYYAWADPSITRRAQERRMRSPRSSPYGLTPADWRADPRTHPMLKSRISFRNVTNRTNSRTLICSLVPPKTVLLEIAPWILFSPVSYRATEEAYVLGVLSSRICDWWVRRFVEGHVDDEAFLSLRLPSGAESVSARSRATLLSGRLAAPDDRFADWAAAVGVECGPLDPIRKQEMIDELDAVVAHLYGLSEEQLVHIFETFHEGWDYAPRLEVVLHRFRDHAARRRA